MHAHTKISSNEVAFIHNSLTHTRSIETKEEITMCERDNKSQSLRYGRKGGGGGGWLG
jgi:hypothetical protein